MSAKRFLIMHRGFAGIGLLASLTWAGAARAAGKVDVEDLRPGLVTTYRDAGKSRPVAITLLEPTVALSLKKGEAPHPRLRADGGTVRWQGYMNVYRPGPYRFSARLRGSLRVTVGGKEVLRAEVKGESPALMQAPKVRLEGGVQPLVAEFRRLPGPARLELFWEAPFFHVEPLSHQAVGHLPDKAPAALKRFALQEHGRYLAEEYNCASCHRPSDQDRVAQGLVGRQGPDLSQVGGRVRAAWMYRWLEAPEKVRPGTPMPRLFAGDEAGRVERYAVTRYLASLGGPFKSDQRPAEHERGHVKQGERLFTSLGCIACHHPESADEEGETSRGAFTGARTTYPLSGLGSKTTPDKLAAYLQNPLAIDPSGRMPSLLLNGNEAADLAFYLCARKEPSIPSGLPAAPGKEPMLAAFRRVDSRAEELKAFERLPADAQWQDLGKRLVIAKRCNNCHRIAPGGKDFATVLGRASFDDIKSPNSPDRGCLAGEASRRGNAPDFGLGKSDREALRRFLSEGTSGAGSPAPAYAGRVALERFNCLACHSRDGHGGLSTKLVEDLRRYEKAENSEAVIPPPLTDAGHKLLTPWVHDVLTRGARARPWMGLRMPQFGEANVGFLAEALAEMDGTVPESRPRRIPLTTAKIAAGRFLAGKQAFGCISCHDLAGIPNSGTRGPDLAYVSRRVRYPWYRRWLEQAQRMQPGTRMPSVFSEGKSTLDNVLGGSANAQAEALWAYFSLGPSLQLPEGMEPPRGLVVTVKDRPVLVRSFMPDAGSRAVAVGYPGGVSTTFDARRCRLAYGWSGNFLDAAPVWEDRGGAPAKLLGARFWVAPAGCPWSVHDSREPPDFAARARDPAYGANLPEGKLYTGKRVLAFEGYELDRAGLPTYRYRLRPDDGHPLEVREKPEPLRSPAGVGLTRHFTLTRTKGQRAWFLAGECGLEPGILNGRGKVVSLGAKGGPVEVAASGRMLVLPRGDGKVIVLSPGKVPEGTRWYLRQQGGTWKVILGLPAAREAGTTRLALKVLAPYRDDPELLKELVSGK